MGGGRKQGKKVVVLEARLLGAGVHIQFPYSCLAAAGFASSEVTESSRVSQECQWDMNLKKTGFYRQRFVGNANVLFIWTFTTYGKL